MIKQIVNSSWLIDQLKEKCGVDSVLCFAGLDLDVWGDENVHKEVVLSENGYIRPTIRPNRATIIGRGKA